MTRLPRPFAIATVAVAMIAVTIDFARAAENDLPRGPRTQQLAYLVRQDCGSCHGMTLAGGLGPSLLPGALAGKSEDYLKLVILHGKGGTAMPGWASLLSDADASWIARHLLQGSIPDAR